MQKVAVKAAHCRYQGVKETICVAHAVEVKGYTHVGDGNRWRVILTEKQLLKGVLGLVCITTSGRQHEDVNLDKVSIGHLLEML